MREVALLTFKLVILYIQVDALDQIPKLITGVVHKVNRSHSSVSHTIAHFQ